MTTIRCAFLILLALIATSCSREVVGTPSNAVPVSSSGEQAASGALFDPCSIPVTALNGVGMFAEPIKKGESTIPPMIICDFVGFNGSLGIVSTSESSVEQMKLDPTAGNFLNYRLGERTIAGGSMPAIRNQKNCVRETEVEDGWVSLYWTGQGDVCALSDAAFVAIDPFLPPAA